MILFEIKRDISYAKDMQNTIAMEITEIEFAPRIQVNVLSYAFEISSVKHASKEYPEKLN